jgi:hypothetical protein
MTDANSRQEVPIARAVAAAGEDAARELESKPGLLLGDHHGTFDTAQA